MMESQSKKLISIKSEKGISAWLIYPLSFFIISITFQNFFVHAPNIKVYEMAVVIVLFIFYVREINKNFVRSIIVFSIIVIIQGFMFGYSLFTHFSSLFFNLFIPYVFLSILPFNYHKYLIRVVFILSIISFSFWIVSNISEPFHQSISEIARTYKLDPIEKNYSAFETYEQILIFTYEEARTFGILRNAGFCHEPGAFSVVLIYALIFNVLLTKKYFSFQNIFFLICLITTFSTAGYAALYLYLLTFYITNKRNIAIKIMGSIVAIWVTIYSFNSLDFMGSKIVETYNTETSMRLYEETSGRFFGARKAIVVLSRYPLTGRGFISASQVESYSSDEAAGYGFMAFSSTVGIPVALLVFFLFYKTIQFWNIHAGFKRQQGFLFSIVFIPVLFAQSFIPSVLFNMIIFELVFRSFIYSNIKPNINAASTYK